MRVFMLQMSQGTVAGLLVYPPYSSANSQIHTLLHTRTHTRQAQPYSRTEDGQICGHGICGTTAYDSIITAAGV